MAFGEATSGLAVMLSAFAGWSEVAMSVMVRRETQPVPESLPQVVRSSAVSGIRPGIAQQRARRVAPQVGSQVRREVAPGVMSKPGAAGQLPPRPVVIAERVRPATIAVAETRPEIATVTSGQIRPTFVTVPVAEQFMPLAGVIVAPGQIKRVGVTPIKGQKRTTSKHDSIDATRQATHDTF